jgi:hypothetical protein
MVEMIKLQFGDVIIEVPFDITREKWERVKKAATVCIFWEKGEK